MKRTGGRWDPNDRYAYFLASDIGSQAQAAKAHDHLLIAVNEIRDDAALDMIASWIEDGKHVFIDSGVYNLTNEHARAHDLTMDEVLAMAPSQLDGFEALLARYVEVIQAVGDGSWGYIEIDQGGLENKRKTRAKLEGMGLKPIPVYHPLVDGWDYFDELAQQYDRICFGNIVQADRFTRRRLLLTAYERRRKYPDLWIHLLGITPNEWFAAYPIDSADSSAWLKNVRWAGASKAHAALGTFGDMPEGLRYEYGADAESETGHLKARRLGAYDAHHQMRVWRSMLREVELNLNADVRMPL